MRNKICIMSVLVFILTAITFSLSFAEGRVIGRSVHFTPYPVKVGETTRITVRFTVTGAPVNLTATVEQTIPRYEGPPPPTIILGTFNPGEHGVDIFRYTVPASPPEKICFNIKMTGGEFRNVCLKRGKGSTGWYMTVDSFGQWIEAIPTPVQAPVPTTEKPDLRIVGNLAIDRVLSIQNIGRAPTPSGIDIDVVRECFVEGRWVPSPEWLSMGLGKRTLLAGESTDLRLGTLMGQCPAGTTKVRVIVDPRNKIDEMDENNNMLEANVMANLKIVHFSTFYPIVGIGGTPGFRVSFEIKNTGIGDAGSFIWEISVFRDGQWRSFIGERITKLNSGENIEITRNVGESIREGERIRLRVDVLNEIPEIQEDDNIREIIVRGRG